MLGYCVVDELDDLFAFDPTVGMKDEIKNALLDDGRIEGCLQIADRDCVVGLV